MAIPHYNFYPPAGQVIDQSDGRVTWNGKAWMLNGRVYGVPSSHRLVGKPGTSYAGWYYDWQKHAWMQPSAATQSPPNGGISQPPQRSLPPRLPVVQPQPPAKAPEKKEGHVEKKHNSIVEQLVKHPVAPVLGGVLLLASNFTDEPQPPQITSDIPEAVAKQWHMIYNQNQQRFQRRMALYEQLGMVLLGYSSAQTMLELLPPKKAA